MKRIMVLLCLTAATLLANLSPAERLNAKLLEYAQNAYTQERWAEAYQAFMRLERTDETLPSIHFYLGRCAYEMGDYDGAKSHFETVLKLKPGHPTASYELARTHLRFARRYENNARELFAAIPPKELPKEARRVVSGYTGFTRLPHSHRIGGELGVYGVLDNQAPALPQLVNARIPLPDPTPSGAARDQSRGNMLTLDVKHRYQESDSCGFRWENRFEADALNPSGIDDGGVTRWYLGTRLSFRVDERFWFSPEYFMQNTAFSDGERTFDQAGWAINVEGTLSNSHDVWGRLAWYNQYYQEDNRSKHRGMSGQVGMRQYFGLHYAQFQLGMDLIYDAEADNSIGLYTQSRLSALWMHRYTPVASGRIEGDVMLVDFDGPSGQREDRVLAAGVGVDLKLSEAWKIDYLVKLSRTNSSKADGSYTRSVVRLGVLYTF
ncbi:MAG: tetratricopeptide repeat protein [Campylobacterales bacterium]